MSILSSNTSNNNNKMGTPLFHEFKKQASFFFKEKIKTARLALTDVTPAELLTEEATSGNSWSPNTRTMGLISRAAFEVDDYWRIVEILHKRFSKFDKKDWRVSYNSLILLEHLLTHGPESAAKEFQSDKDVIKEMASFQYIDDKGFNWGLAVRKKSETISNLLERGPLLKEERDRARKLTRGIQGFGSFSVRSSSSSSSAQGILRESSSFGGKRLNSQFDDQENRENHQHLSSNGEGSAKTGLDQSKIINEDLVRISGLKMEDSMSSDSFRDAQKSEILVDTQTNLKENMAPTKEVIWNFTGESKPLLGGGQKDQHPSIDIPAEEIHPFIDSDSDNQITGASLLSTRG